MRIKIDLEKAYDMLSWPYIKHCLLKFGFHHDWIDLIMHCISSISFSILLNGEHQHAFSPTRGIRHGDPLSPYIFILCMEPLIRSLNSLSSRSKNHVGILSSPHGFRISNLMFADDCLIFARASSVAARNIFKVLNNFGHASGQRNNFSKSTIYFSNNVHHIVKHDISCIPGIQHRTPIGKYLGIHNIVFWKDPANTNDIILRIQKKLAGWKAHSLSRGGRLSLLKANLSGMSNHVFSCFKCPAKVASRIDKEQRQFFWGNNVSSPPIAWSSICLPKEKGGLGIRHTKCFNNAALAKLGWKILTDQQSWWVKIVKAKYLRNSNFFVVKKSSSSSLAWKGILDSRNIIQEGIRWIVGDGNSICFWSFNWAFPFPLLNLIPASSRNSIDWDLKVSHFIKDSSWNREELLKYISLDIVNKICAIPLPPKISQDKMVWGFSGNGAFSVKSASDIQSQHAPSHSRSKLLQIIRNLNIPPKVRVFSWQLIRNRLRTKDNV